jgi:hypothetical protein
VDRLVTLAEALTVLPYENPEQRRWGVNIYENLDAVAASIEEWRFPVLSLEHQIVFEIGHCAWHGFELDLRHIVDLAGRLLLRRETVNESRLSRFLQETGLAEPFLLLVGALSRVLDLPVDDATVAAPASESAVLLQQRLLERSSSIGLERRHGEASGSLRPWRAADRAAFTWKRLVPPLVAVPAAYNLC